MIENSLTVVPTPVDDLPSETVNHDDTIIDVAQFKEMTLDDVAAVLSFSIVRDYYVKLIVFFCMLSAYTDEDQLNVSLNGPSSSGKTYITLETASLFPDEDKIILSGATPTSLFYDEGTYDKKRKARIVQLGRKIMVLSEQKTTKLQETLRPLLSHDKWELEYRITNKDKKGANRAEKVYLQGYPASIFCSANMILDPQEMTRAILLTPEISEEKFKESVELAFRRKADPKAWNEWLESQPERISLKARILAIKRADIRRVIIKNYKDVEARFFELHPRLKERSQRDAIHLMELIKTVTLLNIWFRECEGDAVVAAEQDIEAAFILAETIARSQELNVPQFVLTMYDAFVVPAYLEKLKSSAAEVREEMSRNRIGLSIDELMDYYFRKEGATLHYDNLRRQYLKQLASSGLISLRHPATEAADGRETHIFPKVLTDEIKRYIGKHSGVFKPFKGDEW